MTDGHIVSTPARWNPTSLYLDQPDFSIGELGVEGDGGGDRSSRTHDHEIIPQFIIAELSDCIRSLLTRYERTCRFLRGGHVELVRDCAPDQI